MNSSTASGDPARAPAWDGLLDPLTLNAALARSRICLLDCRFDLAQPAVGLQQYQQGHLPGAYFADLDRDLAGARTGTNGRHPLPERAALAARCAAWGIAADTPVVAYDASDGCYAARAWWLLRWLGHPTVAVLDGGWQAWLAAGLPVSTQVPPPQAAVFPVRPALQPVAEVDAVLALSRAAVRQGATGLLLDARAPDRYAGQNETIDPVAGHIPGAVNRFWKSNLDGQGRFKPAAQLRAEYAALLRDRAPGQVILQCGSGVTACHDALAMHVAGLDGAALFPGSWSQWIADPARPVATGPAPLGEAA